MALPAGIAAAKAAKMAAWVAAQMGIEKPEDALKVILLIIMIPIAVIAIFFVIPVVIINSTPRWLCQARCNTMLMLLIW